MGIFSSLFGRRRVGLTEQPSVGSVSDDYFFRMMSGEAGKYSKPYDREERRELTRLVGIIENLDRYNFLVVGAGTLWYLDLVFGRTKSYTAVEPLGNIYVGKQFRFLMKQFSQIKLIEKGFNEVERKELDEGPVIWVFIFNILAYIEHPIRHINKVIREGDILYISTWNTTDRAKRVRKKYFDYLNSFESKVAVDPILTIGLCHLNQFPFDKLKYYKRHERIKNEITDTLVVYT